LIAVTAAAFARPAPVFVARLVGVVAGFGEGLGDGETA